MKIQDMSATHEGFQPNQAEVAAFLETQPLCVVSTVDEMGQPSGATVAFSLTDRLGFIIGTRGDSRKSFNMQNDSRVALTVTDPEQRYTVQAQGIAKMLGAAAFADYEEEHFRQLPESRPFKDKEGQVHFLITPSRLRFSDCSVFPWVLTELDLDR